MKNNESNTPEHQEAGAEARSETQRETAVRQLCFEPAGDEADASRSNDARLPARTAQRDASPICVSSICTVPDASHDRCSSDGYDTISECRSGPAATLRPVRSSPRIATRNWAIVVQVQPFQRFDNLNLLLELPAEVSKHTSAEGGTKIIVHPLIALPLINWSR